MQPAVLPLPDDVEAPAPADAPSRAIPALDGLRGLAVAMVFFRHAAYLGGYGEGRLPPVLGELMLNGWLGVDLFFILSGFLISRPFFSRRPLPARVYVARRVLRILPAYLVVLGAVVLGAFPLYDIDRTDLGWRIAYHLVFLQDYLPADIVVAFWSLGVEEKFYLVAPVLFPLILRARSPRVQLGLLTAVLLLGPASRTAALAIAGAPPDYPVFFQTFRSPFHACLDGLFWGVLLARLEALRWTWLTPARGRVAFGVGAAALVAVMGSHELLDHLGPVAVVLRPVGIGLLMAMLVAPAIFGGAPRLAEHPFPRWLGRISYSLYLVHIPLLYPSLAVTQLLAGKDAPFLAFLAVYAPLSLLVSHLMRTFVEEPALDLKAKVEPWLLRRVSDRAA